MEHDTRILEHRIDWDQVESGRLFRKFTAVDDGGPEKDYRVVIHGMIDESGVVYILQENVSSEATICGRKP